MIIISDYSNIGTNVENSKLNIIGEHVRYEDDVTNFQQISALGLTLESLSAQTCVLEP